VMSSARAPSAPASGRFISLNPHQREAVEHLDGPLLVVAGAGTGKTRVITERVRWLLETQPDLRGENILAITFTDKAAAEMKARIVAATGKRGEGVWVSTFHSFCDQLLRQHSEPFEILDETDYWIFLRRHIAELGLDLFKKLSAPGAFLTDFCQFFSRCQDELVTPEDYAAHVVALRADFEKVQATLTAEARAARELDLRCQEEIARVYAASERLLRRHARVTFGGLLLRAVQVLQQNAGVRSYWQERLRFILVDEFQDTNIAQIELVTLLAGSRRNVTAVGDDDQAIYRFRGASYGSFRKFTEIFPGHRLLSLEENYRSCQRILAVAQELIRQNGPDRYAPDKQLRAVRAPGEKVHVVEVEDLAQEAACVVQEIERLHAAGVSYDGFAVLYRAHHHRNALVAALVRASIPFVIRKLSILGNTLIRDLIAYLRVLNLPEDSISLARLLAVPRWRLTPDQLCELTRKAHQERKPLHEIVRALHPDVLEHHTSLAALLRLLDELRAQRGELTATELFAALLERLELRLLPADPDHLYLQRFEGFLREWQEKKSQTERLGEFIEYLNYFLEARGRIELPEDTAQTDAVQLMTVHTAKGLEFDHVFVLRLIRNAFPTTRRSPLFEFPLRLMKEELPQGDFHTEEERRLCYVALTRARDRLWLLTVAGRSRPSLFLEDILRDARVARHVAQLAPEPLGAATDDPPTTDALLAAARAASCCYSQIPRWAETAPAPEPPTPLEISHTDIETYRTCPLKYKLSALWRLSAPATPPTIFGKIMHATLADFFRLYQKRPDVSFDELAHLYDQQWHLQRERFFEPYQEEEYRKAGREQLAAFYQQHRDARLDVMDVEKKFRLSLDDIEFTGRIDQVNRLGGRTVEIIEYKTGKARSPAEAEQSLQLSLYAAAAARALRLRPVRLVLYDLTSGQGFATTRTEEQQEKALQEVAKIAAQIRARQFTPRPGFHCAYCDFRPLCPIYEDSFTLVGRLPAEETPSAKKT